MKIMFVCSANVNRSQIAAVLYNTLTQTNDADSAGTDVDKKHPEAKTLREFDVIVKPNITLEALKERGTEVDDLPRKQFTPEMISQYDLVVHFLEPEQRPEWLRGENVIFWDVFDPHSRSLDDVLEAFDQIEPRVEKLIEFEKSGKDFRELDDDGRFIVKGSGAAWFLTDYIRGFGFPSELGDFHLKTEEFHVTLVQDLNETEIADLQKICDKLEPEARENPPRLTGEFLRAAKSGKETIIGLVDFPVVEKWREMARAVVPNHEFDFPHVTLYCKDLARGGVTITDENFAEVTSELDPETYEILHKIWEEKN